MTDFIQVETPVQELDYVEALAKLTDAEKNYAYFMSKASWAGAKMVFNQIIYESPALFMIFQAYFQERDFFKLETAARTVTSQQNWKKFIAYVAGFYGNMGNYHNFGDNKFIPDLDEHTFLSILKSNPLYNDELAFYKQVIDELWPQVKKEVFAMEKPYAQLGFPEKGGVTGYFSRGMTDADLALVKEFLLDQKIDILITRAFKEHGGYTSTPRK